ncbi:DUF4347 domain-containing protein, partial [Microcystis aeruginosa]|uniref:DUF4347 domain-containing protein n=1 Tax=Microcystis aeruginosa TaxID=1126 RepID=UPI0011BF5C68
MSRQTNLNQSVVFLDAGVTDYQSLQAGVIPGVATVILSPNKDGIEQITAFLQQNPQITTIHLVSHGAPGCLYLGNCQLNLTNIYDYRQQLQNWAKINRILLYGCQVAAGDAGEEFIEKLHQLTGATVMASATPTGSSKWGGDWELEVIVSRAESEQDLNISLAFDGGTLATYEGVFALSLVGSYDTPGEAHDVKVVGNYAYVADFSLGLQIIDISNPTNPTLISNYDTYSGAYGVEVVGNYAYVVSGGGVGLEIIDISNSTNPTFISFNPDVVADDLEVVGNYAYVGGKIGLAIIDISNPAYPNFIVYSIVNYSNVSDVQVVGNYAYLASDNGGLQIIDISNPENPTLKGNYDTPGIASDVEVVGNYAYVADGWDGGLQIIDISNPTNPIFIGNYDTNSVANDVEVVGNYAYVADDMAGLKIIDISNPTNPILIDYYDDFSTVAYGVEVVGNYAYVADYFDGLKIIDVSGFNNPSPSITILDFESPLPQGLSSVSFWQFTSVPSTAKITNQYAPSGVLMSGVALINHGLGHAASGVNGIGGIGSESSVDYDAPLTFQFVSSVNSSTPAYTNYFAISPDLWGGSGNNVKITAYGFDNTILGVTTYTETGNLSPSTPIEIQNVGKIYKVVVDASLAFVGGGGIGFDLVKFEVPTVDAPTVTLAVSPSSVNEDGTTNLVYTFTRTGSTTSALTANYTVGGTAIFNTDYSQTGAASFPSFPSETGTVTFAANSATATVTVDPTADTTVEDDETVSLTLTSGTDYTVGTTTPVTGTILNDDTRVTLQVSPSLVTEDGTTNLAYFFYREGVTTNALTVNYTVGGTATLNTDYSQTGAASFNGTTGTVTFAANANNATVTIDPTVDNIADPDETVTLTLASGTGYTVGTTTTVTGTINDDINPPTPTFISKYDTPGWVWDLKVVGNYAYLADWTSGLQIIDISNPTNPIFKGNYDTDAAYGVEVVGNYAYIADGSSGLQIIDISNPSNPTFIGNYANLGAVLGVQVVGNYAYLVNNGASSLEIIDISNPTNPTLKGSYDDDSDPAFGLQVVGNYAYLADGESGLKIIDISNPTNPILKGSYDTSYAFGVQIVGNYAYVADWDSGLQIIDISNSTNPILKGNYYSSGQAANVQVIGNYAYLAAQSGGWGGYGLQIIDISNPTNPTIKGNYKNFYSPLSYAYKVRDVQVVGNYAYAAGSNSPGAGGLQIIDVSDFNDVNESPTNLNLSNNTVAENSPLNTLIGNFNTTDPDTGNTFSYSLVTGIGDTDNSLFTIDGNQLKVNGLLDYETQNNYSIRVKTTDQGGLSYEKQLTVSVSDVNENPTNLNLSNNTVAENSPLNTLIGNFNTTDPDTGNTFTYSLVTGTGDTDNSLFTIDGNQLKVNGLLDYETKNNYSIRVKTTDQGGLSYEKQLTVSVSDVNESPTDVTLSNNTVAENSPLNTLIGNFNTTDPDTGNTFTYSLVTGIGSTDNSLFTIDGNQLKVNGLLDYETKNNYSIRVKTTDQGGLSYEKQL